MEAYLPQKVKKWTTVEEKMCTREEGIEKKM